MCTVTYLPLSNKSFILTHNRDEHHTRSIAQFPTRKLIHNSNVISPLDEQGGGTWFATSEKFTLCLLNGAYEKHVSMPPYKHSRGLIILDYFKYNDFESFRNDYTFSGIEPFTLIVIEHETQRVNQLVFDSEYVYHAVKNSSEKHIWSSSTLYSNEDTYRRAKLFEAWGSNLEAFDQEDCIKFHEFKNDQEGQEGFVINRDFKLITVSLTSVLKEENGFVKLVYKDFIQQKETQLELS